jgi:hypothetical protein
MDSPKPPTILSPITPRLNPGAHTPSRSPTRERLTDDILADLSPSTTFEAFTSPSGKLRASIEAASESERAFGIRATLASKKIQEWVNELSAWSWPAQSGFEMPAAKRRKISDEISNASQEPEYSGSLPTADLLRYEVRVEEITEDMEDLNVEEIKRQVLDTHFSGNSRPSSSASSAPMPSFLSSYTKMDDFTAIVTATVLQALPNLSRLMRLMDVWSIRLSVLRKVPPLLTALDDAEVALKSGWTAIQVPENQHSEDAQVLSRNTFDVMKTVLQGKVTSLGQDLDYMLDTLEGREDTLPDSWLDRMETIEQDYGEWVVSGDRKVREGEWARMAKARKEAEEARRAREAEAAEAARLKAEQEAEAARVLAEEEAAETAKRKAEEDAKNVRRLEEERIADAERQKAEQDAENERLKAEQAAEEVRRKTEEDAELARKLQEEEAVELVRQQAQKDADNAKRVAEEQALEATRQKAEKDAADTKRLQEEETAAIAVQQAKKDVDASKLLEEEQALEATRRRTAEQDATDAKRLQEEEAVEFAQEQTQKDAEAAKKFEEAQALETSQPQAEQDAKAIEAARLQAIKDAENAEAAEKDAQAEVERRTAEQNSVNATGAKKQSTSDPPPKVVEKDEQPNSKEMLPALTTGVAAAIPLPPVDTTFNTYRPPPSRDLSPEQEKVAPFDGSPDLRLVTSEPPIAQSQILQPGQNGNAISQPKRDKSSRPTSIKIPSASHILQAPRPSSPLSNDMVQTRKSPKVAHADNQTRQDESTPSTPKRTTQFEHAFAELIRRSSSPNTPTEESSRKSPEILMSSAMGESNSSCEDADHFSALSIAVSPNEPAAMEEPHQLSHQNSTGKATNTEDLTMADAVSEDPQDVEPRDSIPVSTETMDPELLDVDDSKLSSRHSRNSSTVSGYSISQPTPEILEAEPAEYFRPVLSPLTSPRLFIQDDEPATPTIVKMSVNDTAGSRDVFSTLDEDEEISSSTPQQRPSGVLPEQEATTMPSASEENDTVDAMYANDESTNSVEESLEISQIGDISTPLVARRASLSPIDTGVKLISLSRPQRRSSDTPTIMTVFGGNVGTPILPSSPLGGELESFPEAGEESPSAGRIGLRNRDSNDYSPPDSPPPIPAIRKRGSVQSPTSLTFSTSHPSDTSLSMDAPIFDNVEISETSMNSSPTRTSDDQLQQQISSILESIPTKIHLTSKLDAHQTGTLRPKKTRRSVTPSLRSHSSLSNYSRAPTPSFTLSPAMNQTRSRPRPQKGAPENKV